MKLDVNHQIPRAGYLRNPEVYFNSAKLKAKLVKHVFGVKMTEKSCPR